MHSSTDCSNNFCNRVTIVRQFNATLLVVRQKLHCQPSRIKGIFIVCVYYPFWLCFCLITDRSKEVIGIRNNLGCFTCGRALRELEEEKRGCISRWFTVSVCQSETTQKKITTLLIVFSLFLLFLFF